MQNKIFGLFIFVLFGLAGCGFHLRGSQADLNQLTDQISPVFLSGISKKSRYYHIFARECRRYHIQLAETKKAAQSQLKINRLRFKTHILMVDKRNKAAEYETRLEISFVFIDQAQQKMADKLIVTRSYLVSDLDVLGKNFEREEIRQKMVQQVAQQILMQIKTHINIVETR